MDKALNLAHIIFHKFVPQTKDSDGGPFTLGKYGETRNPF
jgi:hypothetical protein